MKYTVPPDTFDPDPVVGDVNPGPLVGTLVGDAAEELELLDDDDPHAAATSTITPTPTNPNNLRPKLPMLTILTKT